jgi:hypothetical protein
MSTANIQADMQAAERRYAAGMAHLAEAQREIQGEIERRKAPRRQADVLRAEPRITWRAWLAGACVVFLLGVLAGAEF